MKTLEAFVEENPALFRQEELILDVTELIAGLMKQSGTKCCEIAVTLDKDVSLIDGSLIERLLAGEEELTLRLVSDIFGALGYRVRISTEPVATSIAVKGIPSEQDGKPQPTWVPVYVERAICDLIPDTGHAREIARCAWNWDDAHPSAPNALYRWQNEAIRQRRDLIALQDQVRRDTGIDNPSAEV